MQLNLTDFQQSCDFCGEPNNTPGSLWEHWYSSYANDQGITGLFCEKCLIHFDYLESL